MTLAQKEFGHEVKIVRAGKEGDFTSAEMAQLCVKIGIRRKFVNTGTSSENGIVEQNNQTVVEMSRTMLEHRNLMRKLWVEALVALRYISRIGLLRRQFQN